MTSRQTEPDLKLRAKSCLRLVNVGVEDAVDEANGRRLVGVLLRQDHANSPDALNLVRR
jgi:hypothetical protein